MINRFTRLIVFILQAVFVFLAGASAHASEITMAVANSTCSAIKMVGDLYVRHHDVSISYLCKSSGLLAKGLRGKAITADIYISANRRWMDYMIDGGMVDEEQVTSPWGNALVVATRKDNNLEIREWEDLASDKVRTILIGDPGTAPFGRYAKQALQETGLWERIKNKVETKKNITLLAETLAQSDPNTVGILFLSHVGEELQTVYSVDNSWHPPIRYYMSPVGNAAEDAQVSSLLDFIQGQEAREIFRAEGFEITGP
jgi:molybdate transport system substrate-binding protein